MKISEMNEFERPREKIIEKGSPSLTDAELLATILGNGSKGKDVMVLCEEVLGKKGSIFDLSYDDIISIKGIGKAKACKIMAVIEFARRKNEKMAHRIHKAEDVIPLIGHIRDKKQEHLLCITLSGAMEVINVHTVTIGLLNNSQIHPREVFYLAITDRSASIILVHNHPSGNLTPSKDDISTTKKIKDAGKLLGIELRDHIIVSSDNFLSLNDYIL